jgi:hypothetical protein
VSARTRYRPWFRTTLDFERRCAEWTEEQREREALWELAEKLGVSVRALRTTHLEVMDSEYLVPINPDAMREAMEELDRYQARLFAAFDATVADALGLAR